MRLDVDEDAAALLVLAPAARCVGFAERGDPSRLAVHEAEAVEMAAVVGRELRDELRPPHGREAVIGIVRRQAGEPRVDEPQSRIAWTIRHFVNLHVARHVGRARQVAGVVLAGRIELGGDGGHVAKLPHVDGRADRQPPAADGHAHRLVERAEVRVDDAAVGADDDELAGLIGRDQQRAAELIEDRREVRRVNAAQRRRAGIGGAGSAFD